MDRHNQRCDKIIESELKSTPRAGAVKVLARFKRGKKYFQGPGTVAAGGFERPLSSGRPDRPPVVEDQENKWVIRESTRRMRGLIR
jgi:hypothetical protein